MPNQTAPAGIWTSSTQSRNMVHGVSVWSKGSQLPIFSWIWKTLDISNLDPATLPPNLGLFYLASSSDMTIFPNTSNSLHLYKIIASRGQIESIPLEHVLNLPKLYDLVLNENWLIAFPNLSHLKGIIHVVVTNNKLPSVPTEHIAGLPRLRDLFLANNLITAMPNVSYLPKLQTIGLSNNLLTHVPGSCLWGLPILRKLELQSNQITLIGDISSVQGLVYLHDNHLMWPWMKTPPTLDAFLCSGPLQLNGTLAMRVHPVALKCYNSRFTPPLHQNKVTSWNAHFLKHMLRLINSANTRLKIYFDTIQICVSEWKKVTYVIYSA